MGIGKLTTTLTLAVGLAGLAGLVAALGGCTDRSGGGGDDVDASELAFCVDETNRYRATVGRPALARSATLEAFAAEGAMIDGLAHEPHKHFSETNGGNGVTFAENEIPWWSMAQSGTVRDIVRDGLALMWSEGPGGGHYDNMASTSYTELGCGIFINGDEVTVTQDYK